MASRDLTSQTTLLLPAIDFYQNGSVKQIITAYGALEKTMTQYFSKWNEKSGDLEKRRESLRQRQAKMSETIQNFYGAKSAIKVETPKTFPSSLDYDSSKVANVAVKHQDQAIIQTEHIMKALTHHEATISDKRPRDLIGEKPKVDLAQLNEGIKSVFQVHKVPVIFPVNTQPQNGHIDKLYLPRSQHSRHKLKFIDNGLIFNTSNSIFHHSAPERLAEKRQSRKTAKGNEMNVILESGGLTNFSIGMEKNEDGIDSAYTPKTNNQVVLLDVPADNFFAGGLTLDQDFLGDKSGGIFGDPDSSSYLNNFLGSSNTQSAFNFGTPQAQVPAQSSQAQRPAQGAQSGSNQPGSATSGPGAQGGVLGVPSQTPAGTAIPPAPPGAIPPPPPLSILANMGKKPQEEGANISDQAAELKPITEEKRSLP